MANPVDMIASATAEQYGQAARVLGKAPEIDALIVMFNTPVDHPRGRCGRRAHWRPGRDRRGRAFDLCVHEPGGPTCQFSARRASLSSRSRRTRRVRSGGASHGKKKGRPAGNVIRPNIDAHRVSGLVAAELSPCKRRLAGGGRRPGAARRLRHRDGHGAASALRLKPRRLKSSSGARWRSRSPLRSTKAMSAASGSV